MLRARLPAVSVRSSLPCGPHPTDSGRRLPSCSPPPLPAASATSSEDLKIAEEIAGLERSFGLCDRRKVDRDSESRQLAARLAEQERGMGEQRTVKSRLLDFARRLKLRDMLVGSD